MKYDLNNKNIKNANILEQAIRLYEKTFPDWERESSELISQKILKGLYSYEVAMQGEDVIGAYFLEKYKNERLLMVGYIFIDEDNRGKGIGKMLCNEIEDFFYSNDDYEHLILEAEKHLEGFYRNIGYSVLDVDYKVPKFDSDGHVPMAIMYKSKTGIFDLELIVSTLMRLSYNVE